MKFFLGGEGGFEYLERMTYDGVIGLFYKDTLGGVLAYIVFGIVCILAIVGLVTIVKWLFCGRKPKETPHDKWLRTGKM